MLRDVTRKQCETSAEIAGTTEVAALDIIEFAITTKYTISCVITFVTSNIIWLLQIYIYIAGK